MMINKPSQTGTKTATQKDLESGTEIPVRANEYGRFIKKLCVCATTPHSEIRD